MNLNNELELGSRMSTIFSDPAILLIDLGTIISVFGDYVNILGTEVDPTTKIRRIYNKVPLYYTQPGIATDISEGSLVLLVGTRGYFDDSSLEVPSERPPGVYTLNNIKAIPIFRSLNNPTLNILPQLLRIDFENSSFAVDGQGINLKGAAGSLGISDSWNEDAPGYMRIINNDGTFVETLLKDPADEEDEEKSGLTHERKTFNTDNKITRTRLYLKIPNNTYYTDSDSIVPEDDAELSIPLDAFPKWLLRDTWDQEGTVTYTRKSTEVGDTPPDTEITSPEDEKEVNVALYERVEDPDGAIHFVRYTGEGFVEDEKNWPLYERHELADGTVSFSRYVGAETEDENYLLKEEVTYPDGSTSETWYGEEGKVLETRVRGADGKLDHTFNDADENSLIVFSRTPAGDISEVHTDSDGKELLNLSRGSDGNVSLSFNDGNTTLAIDPDGNVTVTTAKAISVKTDDAYTLEAAKAVTVKSQDAVSWESAKDYTFKSNGKVDIQGMGGMVYKDQAAGLVTLGNSVNTLGGLLGQLIQILLALDTVGSPAAHVTGPGAIAQLNTLKGIVDSVFD